jgi:hypothetical protein
VGSELSGNLVRTAGAAAGLRVASGWPQGSPAALPDVFQNAQKSFTGARYGIGKGLENLRYRSPWSERSWGERSLLHRARGGARIELRREGRRVP